MLATFAPTPIESLAPLLAAAEVGLVLRRVVKLEEPARSAGVLLEAGIREGLRCLVEVCLATAGDVVLEKKPRAAEVAFLAEFLPVERLLRLETLERPDLVLLLFLRLLRAELERTKGKPFAPAVARAEGVAAGTSCPTAENAPGSPALAGTVEVEVCDLTSEGAEAEDEARAFFEGLSLVVAELPLPSAERAALASEPVEDSEIAIEEGDASSSTVELDLDELIDRRRDGPCKRLAPGR